MSLSDAVAALHQTLNELYAVDQIFKSGWPEDHTGSILHPPASEAEIVAAESRLGHAFPPSYRAFLGMHRAWEHMWGDHTLIGTGDECVQRAIDEIAEDVRDETEDLKETLGELSDDLVDAWEASEARHLFIARHLVIACNFAGEHMVYDATTRRSDGEMTLKTWDIGYGAQDPMYESFEEFLVDQRARAMERLEWIRANDDGA